MNREKNKNAQTVTKLTIALEEIIKQYNKNVFNPDPFFGHINKAKAKRLRLTACEIMKEIEKVGAVEFGEV